MAHSLRSWSRPLAAALLCLSCLLLAACPAQADAPPAASLASSAVRWFVLIDGGSTGSRAHVHRYTQEAGLPLPSVEESINKKIKPGLSHYAPNPPDVRASIKDLLNFIKETVPKDQWQQTPIHLHATAGLRSVTSLEANAILEVVRDDLMASGFVFKRSWAKIISGEQEGINGWMAVNYLLGVFDAPPARDGQVAPSTGVVEMGGSSMQITFAPSAPTEEDRAQLTAVAIAGQTFYLYTHSFLQYGLQAAEKLYQKLAINEIEEKGNPCYPRAYRHSSIGNFDACTSLVSKVVDKSVKCQTTSCSFNGVYQPTIGGEQFVAIENFYYTAKFFGTEEAPPVDDQQSLQITATAAASADPASALTPAGGLTTGNQVTRGLRMKGKEFCDKEWPALRQEYVRTPAEELSAFCFSAAYQSVVLETGLGFHPEANLKVAKTIAGKGIDWEMGATIFELVKAASGDEDDDEGETKPTEQVLVLDSDGLPIGRRTAAAVKKPASSGICTKCVIYTALAVGVVVLTYVGYTRYTRKASPSAGGMTSYSTSAYNRV